MGKIRKGFSVLFSIVLCILIAATILFSGIVKTTESNSIDKVVKSDTESTMKLAEKYMDVNKKLEEIFSSSVQMENLLQVIESKGKTIQDVSNMLGENVFSNIISKYASGLTEYLANSSTDIYVTKDEVKKALDNSRENFEDLLGEKIPDISWNKFSESFDKFATDVVAGLPEYSVVKAEVFGNISGSQEKVLKSVISGETAWIFLAISLVDALIVALIVRGKYKFILNIGVSMLAGAALSYLICFIMQLNTDSFISESIIKTFALRAVSLVNMISLIVAIVGLILTVIYLIINYKQEKRKKG